MIQGSSAASASVTRTEIAEAVRDAFGPRPVSRAEIIAAAQSSGARAEVVDALQHGLRQEYSDLRQIWSDLPDMPLR